MTAGEHQGLGLLPKGPGSGAKLILKVGRTGLVPPGQARGAAPNPGHQTTPWGPGRAEVKLGRQVHRSGLSVGHRHGRDAAAVQLRQGHVREPQLKVAPE